MLKLPFPQPNYLPNIRSCNMSEFQAVILAGGTGNRLTEVSDHIAKCLLPVAGVPMFWFPLNTVYKTGIKDVKLVVRESLKAEVRRLLDTKLFAFDGMQIELLAIVKDTDDSGTGDVIRQLANTNKLTAGKSVLVVSGDFVSDASIIPMIDQFRAYNALLSCFLTASCLSGPVPGPKLKRSKGRDLVAYSEETSEIFFINYEDDFEKAVNGSQWIQSSPSILLTAALNDCHIYLMRYSCIQTLINQKTFASIKADLIPHILSTSCGKEDSTSQKCLAYVNTHENGTVTAHANNTGAYFEVNKAVLRSLPRISSKLTAGQNFDFKATGISCVDSRIDESSQVASGSVIKRSSVGASCKLLEKSRVENSLIMEGCKIGKGAKVMSSILCAGVELEDGAELKNCIVQPGQKISGKVENEVVEGDDESDDWAAEN